MRPPLHSFAPALAGWLFLLLVAGLGSTPAQAQAPPYTWAAGVGTTTLGQVGTVDRHDCDVVAIATTAGGQTYVTGSFKRSVEFGATTLTSAGDQDIFLAKLDAAGQPLWAVRAGDRGDDAGFTVTVDPAGNVYVAGYFRYSATFGSFTLSSASTFGSFIAKYDPQGVCLWATAVPQAANIGALAVDAADNLVVGGTLVGGTVQFGAITVQGVPQVENAFVAKRSAQGAWLWAVRTGNRSGRLAQDAAGNVYCTGNFGATNAFGSFTLTANGLQDGYIGKLDPAGNWLWVRSAGGPGYDYAAGVGVDYDGNVLVAGGYGQPSATFGSITIPNRGNGNFDGYVVKLDPNGNYLWAQGIGGTDNDVTSDLVVDDDGSAYVVGEYQDYGIGATFGSILMPNLGRRFGQFFVTKLSPTGAFNWVATTSSGTYDEFGQALALDHRGGVYAAGYYTGPSIGFGGTTQVGNPGAHTGFLVKIGDSPLPIVAGLSPAQGAAGTPVVVRGARLAGATAVYFNGVPAASFTVTSPTTLTAVAPPGVTTGPVSVQTASGAGPAGLVFQVGMATSAVATSTSGQGFWPNPVPVGGRLQLGGYGAGRPCFPAQATLYTLLGQRQATCPVSLTGEVAVGGVPPGSYVLVVGTPGHPVSRYPLRVQ
ncbi:IPT/TIG domain-containing protein [Hymenobacter ruricola]|uniref:IPT/TIG domain-containing protein n=1 Tax=Hymenobacter ruricola TaxID=2791023 RepID=A0ABS0I1E6_9BACT|nr:IPT/TIG domain-containing protein [Hymenobacter ruricola]MBF9220717.1 IPT/TIG domain-containing protein [Hymenobacter ruricola]